MSAKVEMESDADVPAGVVMLVVRGREVGRIINGTDDKETADG